MKTDERGVELTVRTCRGCGGFYAWPKGSRRVNAQCPRCAPELPFGNVPAGFGFVDDDGEAPA
jgi:uncharacterized paraquat-inducible protein A